MMMLLCWMFVRVVSSLILAVPLVILLEPCCLPYNKYNNNVCVQREGEIERRTSWILLEKCHHVINEGLDRDKFNKETHTSSSKRFINAQSYPVQSYCIKMKMAQGNFITCHNKHFRKSYILAGTTPYCWGDRRRRRERVEGKGSSSRKQQDNDNAPKQTSPKVRRMCMQGGKIVSSSL